MLLDFLSMLQIVYFCKNNKDKKLIGPVKDYLDSIIKSSQALEKRGKTKQARRVKNLALRLFAIIQHAAEHEGIVHPPLGDKMHGYPFFELRQKHGKQLIRIFYFTYHKEKLVLLHVYDKKEGNAAKQAEIKQAHKNYKLYLSNPKKHELNNL